MTLSVIIPTKNRREDLINTLKSVYEQTCLPDEIIIVDDNISSDVKSSVFSSFNSLDRIINNNIVLKYIHGSPSTGLTQARNRGIKKNGCDIVLFLDDDVILEEDFISNILEIYNKYPDVYGVSGVITNTRETLIGNILHKIFMKGHFTDNRYLVYATPKYRDLEYIENSVLSGGLTSYRKEVFEEFQFDENLVKDCLTEDLDFSFRVSRKYKLAITPKAKLQHLVSGSGRIDFKRHSEDSVLSMNYFYNKNIEKNLYNKLCYIWLNIGYFVYGVLIVISSRETGIITGYINGFRKLMK